MMLKMRLRVKKGRKTFPPKKHIIHVHKNDTNTHIINTIFEETCTRKKPEEHDGFII